MFKFAAKAATSMVKGSRSRSRSRGRSRSRSRGVKRSASGTYRNSFGRLALRLARSRSRSRTSTAVRRRGAPVASFNSGYNLVNMRARNTAKRRMRHRRVRKSVLPTALMSRVSTNLVCRNEIEISRGRILLPNAVDNAVTTRKYLPLQLYELDLTPLSGASSIGGMWQCQWDSSNNGTNIGPGYAFNNAFWLKSVIDGETTNTDSYGPTVVGYGVWKDTPEDVTTKRKWYQTKMDVEMLMYGQSNQDTLFRIDIVRFDTRIGQLFDGQTSTVGAPLYSATASNFMSVEEWNKFWHSLIAPYTQNPTFKPRKVGNLMTIVKSFKYKIPEQNAEYDRQNCAKTKFSIPFNRIINRFWKKGADGSIFDPEDPSFMNDVYLDDYNTLESENGRIDPKYKYFMMVRATNTDNRAMGVSNVISVTPGQDATYDMDIKVKYLVDM